MPRLSKELHLNGAAFGIIFSSVPEQGKAWKGTLYGLPIGIGFIISPVLKSSGIGLLDLNLKMVMNLRRQSSLRILRSDLFYHFF
jgi:hypothetical protein